MRPEGDRFKLSHADQLFVGGKWVAPSSRNKIVVISPNTEAPVAEVAEANERDVDRAVAAARRAFDEGPWPRMKPTERAAKLRALADCLRARADEFTNAWTDQIGVLPAHAQFANPIFIGHLEYYAGLAETFAWEDNRTPQYVTGHVMVVQEPVGVVAAITPWNGPHLLMGGKVAPALIAGCTIVMKPAPETPVEAYLLAECVEAVGFPDGVINLVPAHRETADYLVSHPGIDKVSFTGSVAAGRRIASVCADRMARVSLELGGKSAAILLDDYDPAEAARMMSGLVCFVSSQSCGFLSRVLVSARRKDAFVDALAEGFRAIKVGSSYDPATQMGPLAMKRQLERVQGYVAKGKASGARLVTGGGTPNGLNRGYFIEPTVFADVDNASAIAQEEIFGPVVSVVTYKDEDEAIRIANDSVFGLYGAVFTKDTEKAYAVARRVRTGSFTQNEFKVDYSMPFGGFKQSGIGRQNGLEGLMPFLESKTIYLDRALT